MAEKKEAIKSTSAEATADKEVKKTPSKKGPKFHYGLGRRKTSIARVKLYPGTFEVTANEKEGKAYFGSESFLQKIKEPLALTGNEKFKVVARVSGGGKNAQAEAIRLGVARALVAFDEKLKVTLKKAGFLTRDPRMKERKKPGLKRARKAPQFTKR